MTIAQETKIQAYQLKKGGTPARLAILKMIAAESKTDKRPPSMQYATWREARDYSFKGYQAAFASGLNRGFNGDGPHRVPVWYCHTGDQFRGEQFADQCARMDHTGWFTNEHGETYRDGSGLARGIVGRLTHGRFIAGYWWGDNGERVYFPDVFDDENDAARMADEHARIFAEIAREDNANWNAARALENENENALQRLSECLALRHRACMEYVRDEARELIQKIRDNRETLRTEYANCI